LCVLGLKEKLRFFTL